MTCSQASFDRQARPDGGLLPCACYECSPYECVRAFSTVRSFVVPGPRFEEVQYEKESIAISTGDRLPSVRYLWRLVPK